MSLERTTPLVSRSVSIERTADLNANVSSGNHASKGLEIPQTRPLPSPWLHQGEADRPLDYVQHGLGGFREVIDVLRGEPEPGAELAAHLGDLEDVRGEEGILGDYVSLVGDVHDGTAQALVALGNVVDGIQQRDVCDRKFGVLALAGERGEIHDRDIDLGPGTAGTIKKLAIGILTEDVHGVRHLGEADAADLGEYPVPASCLKGIPDALGERRPSHSSGLPGRSHDALADDFIVTFNCCS